MHSDIESIIFCIDFNSRIGKTQDCNDCTDKLPPRTITDNTQNQHGNSLLEFLNDSRCCVLNGRHGDGSNEYTFHSTRGKSIVDYICVPHDVLKLCKNVRITSRKNIEKFNLFHLLGEECKIPDHALLSFDLVINTDLAQLSNTHTTQRVPPQNSHSRQRYNLRRIPRDFMKSDLAITAITGLIDNIEHSRTTQNQSDKLHDDLCNTIINEMENVIPKIDCSEKTRKKFKYHKPYWNEELTSLWKTMRENEKQFLKSNSFRRDNRELL